MAGLLELSVQRFYITMHTTNNILKALMEKVDSMHGDIGNVSRERGTIIKSQRKY